MKPFKINNKKEVRWAREWLTKEMLNGGFDYFSQSELMRINEVESMSSFLTRHLHDVADRARLQKALSARRARESKGKKSTVTTEITPLARKILLAVAERRGITTSELICSAFGNEFYSDQD